LPLLIQPTGQNWTGSASASRGDLLEAIVESCSPSRYFLVLIERLRILFPLLEELVAVYETRGRQSEIVENRTADVTTRHYALRDNDGIIPIAYSRTVNSSIGDHSRYELQANIFNNLFYASVERQLGQTSSTVRGDNGFVSTSTSFSNRNFRVEASIERSRDHLRIDRYDTGETVYSGITNDGSEYYGVIESHGVVRSASPPTVTHAPGGEVQYRTAMPDGTVVLITSMDGRDNDTITIFSPDSRLQGHIQDTGISGTRCALSSVSFVPANSDSASIQTEIATEGTFLTRTTYRTGDLHFRTIDFQTTGDKSTISDAGIRFEGLPSSKAILENFANSDLGPSPWQSKAYYSSEAQLWIDGGFHSAEELRYHDLLERNFEAPSDHASQIETQGEAAQKPAPEFEASATNYSDSDRSAESSFPVRIGGVEIARSGESAATMEVVSPSDRAGAEAHGNAYVSADDIHQAEADRAALQRDFDQGPAQAVDQVDVERDDPDMQSSEPAGVESSPPGGVEERNMPNPENSNNSSAAAVRSQNAASAADDVSSPNLIQLSPQQGGDDPPLPTDSGDENDPELPPDIGDVNGDVPPVSGDDNGLAVSGDSSPDVPPDQGGGGVPEPPASDEADASAPDVAESSGGGGDWTGQVGPSIGPHRGGRGEPEELGAEDDQILEPTSLAATGGDQPASDPELPPDPEADPELPPDPEDDPELPPDPDDESDVSGSSSVGEPDNDVEL
jgi:hypothetical protein